MPPGRRPSAEPDYFSGIECRDVTLWLQGLPPILSARMLQPVPTEAEMRILLEQPDVSTPIGIRDRAILETIYSAGIRRQETADLKVGSVNLNERVFRVMGKGQRERMAPLGPAAVAWIARYLAEVRPGLAGSGSEAALWLAQNGRPLSGAAMHIMLWRYVKEPIFLPGSVLTHEQVQRLVAAVPTDTPEGYRLRTMLEVLYSSGLRIAELLGLDLGDVDFGSATAKVLGKGRKERIVPVGRTALQFLEGYIRAVRPLAVGTSDEKAIFVNADGRRFTYYTFLRMLHATARRAGLPANVTPHTFRRSCATELLRGGANMYHVKDLLGHESLDTLKPYARLTILDLKKEHQRCHPQEKDGCSQS